jgi:hypothetical protein
MEGLMKLLSGWIENAVRIESIGKCYLWKNSRQPDGESKVSVIARMSLK